MSPIKVLFICKGNICRSPTAHGVFRKIIKQNNLQKAIQISSYGTCSRKYDHEGGSIDIRAIKMANSYDCDLSDLISEQLEKFHFDQYDYIVAMDQENIDTMKIMFPQADFSKVSKILQNASIISLTDVPDPYYDNNFREVFLILEIACHRFLDKIKQKHTL